MVNLKRKTEDTYTRFARSCGGHSCRASRLSRASVNVGIFDSPGVLGLHLPKNPIFRKNGYVPKNLNGEIFEIEAFVLKYISDHSKSISINRIEKNFFLCHFLPPKRQK